MSTLSVNGMVTNGNQNCPASVGALNQNRDNKLDTNNNSYNGKYASSMSRLSKVPSTTMINGDTGTLRRSQINRQGSIVHNQFRGIKKQQLDTQTDQLIHSMTVRLIRKLKYF